MVSDFWKSFKSGTDIRGVASEGVAGQPVNLTDEVVSAIAAGFAQWLSGRTGKPVTSLRIGVGHDCRISSDRIDNAVSSALCSAGVHVLRSGLASTPSMFMMTLDCQLDGAVQITASHHPFNRNGLKFFTPDGGLDGSDITAILGYCSEGTLPPAADGGVMEVCEYMPRYAKRLRDTIIEGVNADDREHPLKGFRLVVDAGNGVGGFYAQEVLEKLGADITGSRYLEPDGMFPNHAPNPENPDAMRSVTEAVKLSGADLGIVFDTDVDRAGAVDASGAEINRNRLIALMAAIVTEANPGATIVTDSTTSAGLRTFIEEHLGGRHYRYRRGYRNVIVRAQELCAEGQCCPLAIETSGHAALSDNYFLDDGAYLITRMIIKMAQLRAEGKTLAGLTEALVDPADEKELRLPITTADFRAYGEQVLARIEAAAGQREGWIAADDNREGFRATVSEADGWFLLRLSVHDPIMPLNLESNTEGGCRAIAQALLEELEGFDCLDLAPLRAYIG